MMKPSQILIEARAKIADPAHWTQREYARNADNRPVSARAKTATCFCLQGAIKSVASDDEFFDPHRFLRAALPQPGLHTWAFNDDPKTEHADVLALFDRAIKLAQHAESLNPSTRTKS